MRIITGVARGIKLLTLDGLETRPTAERTKEAIFSMLQFDIEGRKILDMFSGSGQMALEALSRGAESAVMLDKSKAAVEVIVKNSEKTKLADRCKIICTDYEEYLKRNKGEKFDIIFIDPPYASNHLIKSLWALYNTGVIKATTILVCESGREDIFAENLDLVTIYNVEKTAKYGTTYINILMPKGDVLK